MYKHFVVFVDACREIGGEFLMKKRDSVGLHPVQYAGRS